jgi:FkbM family methyltransferase
VRLGSDYGAREIPGGLLGEGSVCYSGGVGDDVSFDLALIERHGCVVHAFDPTPRSSRHGSEVAAREPRFRFHPYALAGSDGELVLHAPAGAEDPEAVQNWSIERAEGSSLTVTAPSRSLRSLMAELGHDRIDLLKLDIEGAEYEVLRTALDEQIPIRILCVEFHKNPSIEAMIDSARALAGAGFEAVAVDGFDATFVAAAQA